LLKPSRAISHVNVELKTNVSEISSASIIIVEVMNDHASQIHIFVISTLMMEAEIFGTLVFRSTRTWLTAQEHLCAFIRRQSFKSFI
jgi:hypothetical protein